VKAPFPWFGGKSRVADLVWDRFGNVPNYGSQNRDSLVASGIAGSLVEGWITGGTRK